MSHRSRKLMMLAITLFAFLFAVTAAGSASAGQSRSPNAPAETPQRVINSSLTQWTMDDTFLYWSDQCEFIPRGGDAAAADSLLMRRAVGGGVERTLDSQPSCLTFEPLASDESGVYYADSEQGGRILRHAPDDPDTPITITSGIGSGVNQIELTDDFVYWTRSGDKISRAPRTGGTAVIIADLPTSVIDFVVEGSQIYAAGFADGVYWVNNVNCPGPPCEARKIATTKASHILVGSTPLVGTFYVVERDTQQLRRLGCDVVNGGCTTQTLHDTPAGFSVRGLVETCIPTFGNFCSGDSHIFLTEVKDIGVGSRVVRVALSGGADEIGIGDRFLDGIAIDRGYVYYAEKAAGKAGIYRLPFRAASITRDLEAAAWEVTQAIQNLDNDIGLVAGKKTFVVAHGTQALGPRAMSVEAVLVGKRGGVELDDSPLNSRVIPAELQTGQALTRFSLDQGWLFELPTAWVREGTLELELVVDPREAYSDSDRSNNSLTDTFSFVDDSDACLLFSPVRTHAGVADIGDPNVGATINRFTSLWPVARTTQLWMGEPIEELEVCFAGIVPYPCMGPYELDQGLSIGNFPPDRDRVIGKLIMRQALLRTVAVAYCSDSLSAQQHSVGMVHPESDTTDSEGTTFGYANLFFNASWVKFPAHDATPDSPRSGWPFEGGVMAQEITHNLGRNHVDCGDPDNIDNGYPYDPCKLDDGALDAPDTYYGFDSVSHEIVRPDQAKDFMSYSTPFWVSDYTYRAVRSDIRARISRQAARNELAAAGEIIYISGYYEPNVNQGALDYAYRLDAANLEPAQLAPFSAPDLLSGFPAYQPSHGGVEEIAAQLLLKDAGGAILGSRAVELIPTDNHKFDADSHFFAAAFPAPAGQVATVQLVVGNQVVAETTPGPNAPQVQLLEPTAGATLDQTIRVRWTASDIDGDTLLHTVSYSPDGGQTWITLVTNYPSPNPLGDEVVLTLQNPQLVPGSNGQALVKVATSDGYNTTELVSSPFSVAGRAPVAMITSPAPEQVYEPGAPLLFSGAAYDAEDGSLPGEALAWNIDRDTPVGSGETLVVEGIGPMRGFVVLTATDSDGQTGDATAEFEILPVPVPESALTPTLDGRCDDLAYADVTALGLAPYPGGGQAFARLTRTATDLYVCFSGLERGATELTGLAGLYLDGDFSRNGEPQDNDQGFVIGEDGTPQRLVPGFGASLWQKGELAGFAAKMTSDNDTIWQAELRIPEALVINWEGRVALAPIHALVEAGGATFGWPFDASEVSTGTWAQALLGSQPRLDGVDPQQATLGDSQLALTLDGRLFEPDAVASWDGVPLPTTVVSPTRLTTVVPGSLLDGAGAKLVRVTNPSLSDFPSNARQVVVANPTPVISNLSPATVQAASGGLSLTVNGSGFVPGAQVQLNGDARATAFISSGQLQVSLSGNDILNGGVIMVTVSNPAPVAAVSNSVPFTIVPQPGAVSFTAYLPVGIDR